MTWRLADNASPMPHLALHLLSMVLLSAWQRPSLLRRSSAGGHLAAVRSWPSRVPRPPSQTLTAPPAVPAAEQQQRYAARPGVRAGASQQQLAGQPTPGMDTAAYLEQHGISAAQLQQEQPATAAALTLPLAQLLVKAVTARQGLKNTLTAAELAARLVFLAREAGVPVSTLEQAYLNQLRYLQFKVDSAREVLAWLRASLDDAALQRIMAKNLNMWRSLRHTLESAKSDMQQLLGLSHAEWVAAVQGDPMLMNSFSGSAAADVVVWLRSGVGMSEGDVLRLFKRQPSLFYQRASRLSELLDYMLDRLHINRSKAPSLVLRCFTPGYSQKALERRVADLELYGFTASQIGGMLPGCPLLLGCSFQSLIFPALSELEQLLTGHLPGMTTRERQADVVGVAVRAGGLLVTKPDNLRGNFDFLVSQGLLLEEARTVLRRNPQLFVCNMRSQEFRAKLRYYEVELGIPTAEILAKHSAYLKEGLAKVDQRVFCMERRGELWRLWPGKSRVLAWTACSTARFCTRFGVSLEEWEECTAVWPGSQRAQQYGLVEQASKRSFYVDYDKAGAANKATFSRRREKKQ